MHVQHEYVINWLGILLIAGIITALIAAVQHPSARPRLLMAVALVVAGVVLLRFLAMPAHQGGRIINGAAMTSSRVASAGSETLIVVLLPLIIGGAYFATRRRHGHGPWWWPAVLAVIGLFWVGGISTHRSQRLSMPPPPIAVHEHLPDVASSPTPPASHEEPVDELWMRLNEPRIQLSAPPRATPAELHEADAESAWVSDANSTRVAEAPEASPAKSAWVEQEHAEPPEPVASAPLAAGKSSDRPRPDWVGQPARMVGEIYRAPVQAGPYVRLQECHDELRDEMRLVVHKRVADLIRERTGTDRAFDNGWFVSDSYVDRELLRDSWVEVSDTSVGPMQTVWALLEFTPAQDDFLVNSWKTHARRRGIAQTAVAALLVMAVVGGAFALLQVDTWTRGYYTKRLFLGVPAAIIVVIVLFAVWVA